MCFQTRTSHTDSFPSRPTKLPLMVARALGMAEKHDEGQTALGMAKKDEGQTALYVYPVVDVDLLQDGYSQ